LASGSGYRYSFLSPHPGQPQQRRPVDSSTVLEGNPAVSTPNPSARQASNAAAAIREINHETFDKRALPYPPMVSEIVQPLVTMLDRLPQTLEQLARAVHRHQADGLIRTDDGSDPDEAAAYAIRYLGQANEILQEGSKSLHRAASLLFHFGTETRV
jgi:hypothetical protein